tara:strand:+ start:182 stop:436 length:255 start_codon:yes stop_codon:yes gene_type:complete
MIKKYYVTCADLKIVTHAHSGPQAIFFALDQMGKERINKLSNIIRISERGHEEHTDDELFLLADMFTLWILDKNWDGAIDGLPE